jgi:hypothetical protein
LQITITGIEGIVQARSGPDQPWGKAQLGMVLNEGAEFRTGPRSAVRFTIPPDQTVTLDRLGTVQVLRSNFQNGKIMTDLGMKYGRTRYDIEAAGREHEATVRSPSSVLAVRGTQVSLYDQPPFTPEAVSLTGRALFKDPKKQVGFGNKGAGKTKIDQKSDTPADYALNQTNADPRGDFIGQTDADRALQAQLVGYPGAVFAGLNVSDIRGHGTGQAVIGVLPVGRQLEFLLSWTGDPFGNVDLSVQSPLGETVSLTNPIVPSSGQHLGDGVADANGTGQEQIIWQKSYPPGTYTVTTTLKSGQAAATQVFVIDDPNGAGTFVGTVTGQLSPDNPTATGTVTAPSAGAAAKVRTSAVASARRAK